MEEEKFFPKVIILWSSLESFEVPMETKLLLCYKCH